MTLDGGAVSESSKCGQFEKEAGPQITFVMLAYNQEKFVRFAVESILAQDYPSLEIILSDDCSTDSTFKIMNEVAERYCGPHKVILRRSSENRGLVEHLRIVVELATSDYIIAAAGDDISEVHRASTVARYLGSNPYLISSDYSTIDSDGNWINTIRPPEAIQTKNIRKISVAASLYVGATGVWHKSLFKNFPPFSYRDCYEDLVLGYRAALLGRIEYIPEKLVRYRIGEGMTTTQIKRKVLVEKTAKARIASLQQRYLDTDHIAPHRHDLKKRIVSQIRVEKALEAFSLNFSRFLMVYAWDPKVITYFLRAAHRWLRRAAL